MRNKFALLNVILIIYTVIACFLYYQNGGILLKGMTSFGFVLIALTNVIYVRLDKRIESIFPVLILFGAISSFMGDIILNIDFIIGAAFFALGHIFYLASYCSIKGYKVKDLLVAFLIFIPSAWFVTSYDNFNFGSNLMMLICIVYALIISLMLGKSISLVLQRKSRFSYSVTIGTSLFFVSDLALLFYMFANAGEAANIICMITYFPAQVILALSIFYFS